jgi:uncharacterized membrane protein
MMHWQMMPAPGGWWWPHELIWGILILIVVVIVLVAVWPLLRAAAHHRDPESILRQRFARGEVDEEQFERMLKRLRLP